MKSWADLDPALLAQGLQRAATGLALLDREGRILAANAAAEQALRLAPGTAKGVSLRDPSWVVTTIDGDPLADDDRPVLRSILKRERVDMEIRIEPPGADPLFLAVQVTPVLDESGEVEAALAFLTDIEAELRTRRIQSLEELDFRPLFDDHPHPHWIIDAQTSNCLDANTAAERVYGYSRDQWRTMSLDDLQADREEPLLLERARPGSPGWHDHGTTRHRTRTEEVISVRVRTYTPSSPRASMLLVQARLQARDVPLTPSPDPDDSLHSAFARSPLILFAVNPRGIFTLSTGRGLASLGLKPGEVVGRSVYDVYQGNPQIVDDIHRALAGEEVAEIVEVQTGPGVGRFYDTLFVPQTDPQGRITGLLGIATDVTDLHQSEKDRSQLLVRERAARAEAEQAQWKAAFLAESSRLLASSLDHTTTFASIARLAIPHLADWCAVDVIEGERAVRRVAVAHVEPELNELAQDLLTSYELIPNAPGIPEVLRTSRSMVHRETNDLTLVTLGSEGAHLRILTELGIRSAMVVPLVARWRTLGAITFVSSRSHRHYVPPDLELAENLASRCALAVDNARLFREAKEAVRVRDEFLSIASHELRTPLTSLLLQIQYLLDEAREAQELDPGEISSMLESAERHIDRLSKLISNLLDVSRIEAHKLELELESVDLAALFQEVLARLSGEAERSGCRLKLDVQGRCVGLWDRLRLEQVATNLLSNALKYGRGKPVTVTLDRNGDRAVITVQDRGIGISPDKIHRIFERFQRAVSGPSFGGLGLGLYIVRHLVTALGGTVAVESEPDRGATFRVELPLEPQLPSPA